VSIPSVVFGLFGLTIFKSSTSSSIFPGCLILAMMILPIMMSRTIPVFKSISNELKENAIALGFNQYMTSKIVFNSVYPELKKAIF
jgi:ABC-type phosphate transport system permease subunit